MRSFKDTNLRKTIRILVYPNITFNSLGKDIEADSFVQVLRNQIALLNELRKDIYFYILLPKEVESLKFKNTEQLIFPLPTYPQTMRSHFDVELFRKLVNHDLDIDLVFSHLPEQTHAIKNVLYNVTHHRPSFFGYVHWLDLKQVVKWPVDTFVQNITGLLECDRVFINTQYQKNLALNQAKEHFNQSVISRLNKILKVQYLGVDRKDIVRQIKTRTKKIIVFNHRPDTYKHYPQFIKLCDRLWRQRKDFQVWVPLLNTKTNRPYLTNESGDKNFYYKKLRECRVGFSPKQVYGGWSIATTDGMMNGVPYIMFDAPYYKELCQKSDFFSDDKEALQLLNKYLDDPSYRNRKANTILNYTKTKLVYKNEMRQMSQYIDELVLQLPRSVSSHLNEDDDNLKQLFNLIHRAGKRKTPVAFTKRELFQTRSWGRGMAWTPYRQRLLSHGAIYDVNQSTPMYVFSPSKTKSYKQDSEYKQWQRLIRLQDKKDKKTISQLQNKRIRHKATKS